MMTDPELAPRGKLYLPLLTGGKISLRIANMG